MSKLIWQFIFWWLHKYGGAEEYLPGYYRFEWTNDMEKTDIVL